MREGSVEVGFFDRFKKDSGGPSDHAGVEPGEAMPDRDKGSTDPSVSTGESNPGVRPGKHKGTIYTGVEAAEDGRDNQQRRCDGGVLHRSVGG